MLLELLLVFIVVIIILYIILIPVEYTHLHPRTIIKMSKLPGPTGLFPLFGLAHILSRLEDNEFMPFLESLRQDYPRMAAFWVVGFPQCVLYVPDDVEVILSSAVHIQKGRDYDTFEAWLKEGLIMSSGEKWHQRRKLLTPAFHFKILEDSMQSLNKHAKNLLKNMLNKEGQSFIVHDMTIPCTLDIICETAMGYSLELQNDNSNKVYLNSVRRVIGLAIQRMLKIALSRDWIYNLTSNGRESFKSIKFLHNFTEKIIKERKMANRSTLPDEEVILENKSSDENDDNIYSGKRKKAFLDIMIDMNKKEGGTLFTDSDIREEVDTFMLEGHETTNASLVHTLYLLGRHTDIQEKAYQELYEIFGDSDRSASRKDLNQMHYLEMIIKESLRLYPSVPAFGRLITQDLHLKDNVILPAGMNMLIFPYVLHRDPKFYPDPEVFDPERFSVENCKNRHPYVYIPFSAGPRNCIGQRFAMMELKLVLSTIIRFAKIHSVNKVDRSKFVAMVILRSKEQIQIRITPRT